MLALLPLYFQGNLSLVLSFFIFLQLSSSVIGLVFILHVNDCPVSYLSLVGERMLDGSKATSGHVPSFPLDDEDTHWSGNVPLMKEWMGPLKREPLAHLLEDEMDGEVDGEIDEGEEEYEEYEEGDGEEEDREREKEKKKKKERKLTGEEKGRPWPLACRVITTSYLSFLLFGR